MDVVSPAGLSHFHRQIYSIFLAVVWPLLFVAQASGQEIGAYKTLLSGDFNQPSLWAVWNGNAWIAASQKPGPTQDIYIDQSHSLRLLESESVKNLYIHAGAGAGQKLNLNGFNLDIYGTLAAFTGAAPGLPRGALNSQNWIGNSSRSTLTFKGSSRVVVDKVSWSALTTQSRFGVIFDPDPEAQLTLMAPLKALFFRVRSGTLYQKVDITSSPNTCFTLSFNTETALYGAGPFGNVTVENGATFRSDCSANLVNRSASGQSSALHFELQREATLVLHGAAPKIEAAHFVLEGRILFEGKQGSGTFLSSSFPSSEKPLRLYDLEIRGTEDLFLPAQLTLLGNLHQVDKGKLQGAATHLILEGDKDQELQTLDALEVGSLTLDKPEARVFLYSDLNVGNSLVLKRGSMDFQGHALEVNRSRLGGYRYSGGSWKNMGQFTYFGLPRNLDASNATFPHEDVENGGIRSLQLFGQSSGGTLSLRFIERKGANHDANFSDLDGSPILYQLYSHFQFSLSPTAGEQEVELRVSAANLLLEQMEDLRIVGTGQAAPGTHLQGVDSDLLWARRRLKWAELGEGNFTIGSYREATVLPLTRKFSGLLFSLKKATHANLLFPGGLHTRK